MNKNTNGDREVSCSSFSDLNVPREGDRILENIFEVKVPSASGDEKQLDNEDVSQTSDEDEKDGPFSQEDDEEELHLLVSESDHKPDAVKPSMNLETATERAGPQNSVRPERIYRGEVHGNEATLYPRDYGADPYISPRQSVARSEHLRDDRRPDSHDGREMPFFGDSGSQRRRSVSFTGGDEHRSVSWSDAGDSEHRQARAQSFSRKPPRKSRSHDYQVGEAYPYSTPRQGSMRLNNYAQSQNRQSSGWANEYAITSSRQPSMLESSGHHAQTFSAHPRYRSEDRNSLDSRQRQSSRRALELSAHSQMKKKAEAAGRMEDLLYELFPKHVARALRDGKKVEPESFECVTVCFMDIVGYTVISSKLSAVKISELLDRLYTKFDDLCGVHNVFKVETVGDAYMTVTNLASRQHDHVKKIVQFVLDAIKIASETLVDEDDPSLGYITMRGGVHSGPVVAHVIGSRTPRYSLIGDTVNTSSRMESHSLPGRIQLSEASATLLKSQGPEVHLQCRGIVPVKGKGDMTTYWVGEFEDNCSLGSDGGCVGTVNMSSNCSVTDISIGEASTGSQMSGLTALTEEEQIALEEKLIRIAMEQSMKESENAQKFGTSSWNDCSNIGYGRGGPIPRREDNELFYGAAPSGKHPCSVEASYSNGHLNQYPPVNRAISHLSDHAESIRLAELEQEREMMELAIQLSLQEASGTNGHGAGRPAALYHSQY